MSRAWFFLVIAIATEVGGTLSMHQSGTTQNPWMYLMMILLVCCSYVFLSFSLKKIHLGIAIAIWEGLGTALITLISIIFLAEVASPQKLFGIALAMAGIGLLHYGEAK